MIPAEIRVVVDEKSIKAEIDSKVSEAIHDALWFVDTERIAEKMCMSQRFLEEHIFNDPRIKVLEVRRSRKRWYPAKQFYEVVSEIMSEW